MILTLDAFVIVFEHIEKPRLIGGEKAISIRNEGISFCYLSINP